jgi:hypothetical protein
LDSEVQRAGCDPASGTLAIYLPSFFLRRKEPWMVYAV